MNKDQGQRGGDGRTEEVNRAEDDSNPFDLLSDELLKIIIEHSPSGLSRGSFVRAFPGSIAQRVFEISSYCYAIISYPDLPRPRVKF